LAAAGLPAPTRSVLTGDMAGPRVGSVRQHWHEHPVIGLTPEGLHATLSQAEAGWPARFFALADDLGDRDLHYRAVSETRRGGPAHLEITVEAASDAPDDVRNADLIRDWLHTADLDAQLPALMDAVFKGYAVTELVWEGSEGQWRPSRLLARNPRWFRPDPEDLRTLRLMVEGAGDAPGLPRTGDPQLAVLPPGKFIVHESDARGGIPLVTALARPAAWGVLFKTFAVKDWLVFSETYGMPFRVGKYRPGLPDAEIDRLFASVRAMGSDAAAVIPDDQQIEIVSLAGQAASDLYERLAVYFDLGLSKVILGQTTTTDAVNGGHAVSREHQQVREDIERRDARALAATLNRDLVRPWVLLEHGRPARGFPRLRIGRPDELPRAELARVLASLVPLGLRVGESDVRDRLGLPEPGPEQEVLRAPTAPAPEAGPQPQALPALQAAQRAPAGGGRDLIDDTVDAILAMTDPGSESAVAVLLAGEAAGTFEEFLARLAAIAAKPPAGDFVRALERAGFGAAVAGRLGMPLSGEE